jgi:hypothetical protein
MNQLKIVMSTENYDTEHDDIYCSKCNGCCGEEGCCSPLRCIQEDGLYCDKYLIDLKFGYEMHEELLKLLEDDIQYKKQIDNLFDVLYKKYYGL